MFELTDLFAAGIGLDLAGAYLLALGLLLSPSSIRRRSTWGGVYPGGLVDDIENRSTARVGVMALCTGFSVQAVAYVLQLVIEAPTQASWDRGMIGALSAAIPAVLVLFFERATRRRRFNRLAVRVACETGGGSSGAPDVPVLVRVAEWRGERRLTDESEEAFASRVFRLREPRS